MCPAKAGATAPNADASTEPPASAPTEEESPPVVAAEEVKAEEPRGIVAPATPVAIEEAEEEEFGTQPTESVGQGPAVTINKEGVTEGERFAPFIYFPLCLCARLARFYAIRH